MGTASVIQAIAAARKAATNIDIYLGGDGDIKESLASEQVLNNYIGKEENFAGKEASKYQCISVENRINNFNLVTVGLDEKKAQCEASRCLQCDLRPRIKKSKFWTEYKIK